MGAHGLKCVDSNIIERGKRKNSSFTSHIFPEFGDKDESELKLNYKAIKYIGKGAFGNVYLVKENDSSKYYAMKVIKKDLLTKQKDYDHLNSEKSVLGDVTHPFILDLHHSYQSKSKVYFIMEFANGGSLKYHLLRNRIFSQDDAKFYGAEILLALEYLHKGGYVWRDLKLENVLLDSQGHVKLADFGLAKKLIKNEDSIELTNTFGGTPEYLAPEVINRIDYGFGVDWWSFGVLLYAMLSGTHPFRPVEHSKKKMMENIVHTPAEMLDIFSEEAKDLLKNLLEIDRLKRLGPNNGDVDSIKSHKFFSDIDWVAIKNKEVIPPFVPDLAHEHDTSYVDRKLTTVSFASDFCGSTIVEEM